ncbi:hypothetical protein [Herbaspirillum sp. ST 5-3]|uniref:hypothetical protein n=1 Tax=Oxalobacteraceae TaxID=75682 RepID=UPI0010A4517A|nr:hypothetical protein [Herbaspirillum sp. ST 5-3]
MTWDYQKENDGVTLLAVSIARKFFSCPGIHGGTSAALHACGRREISITQWLSGNVQHDVSGRSYAGTFAY